MSEKKRIRIDKLLANLGYGSRREVQIMISAGLVTFQEKAVNKADLHVTLEPNLPAHVLINGEMLDPLPGLTLVMNKPLGLSCSRKEEGGIVYDLLPERWQKRDPAISTIGRLDKETSGLLLLTDDGALLHRVTSPKKEIVKCYHVTLEKPLQGNEAEIFASGSLMLDGEAKPLMPAWLTPDSPNSALVRVKEGRYHQVRRMFSAVGNKVTALHRQSIGGLPIPKDLGPGDCRALTATELAAVFEEKDQTGLKS